MWMKNLRREVHGNLSFFSARDEIVAVGQMDGRNFHKGLVMSVAARCKWGMPQVLKCRPFYRGRPFPTLFWLTCPHLAYQCGRLESGGGVKELEDFLSENEKAYRLYNFRYAWLRISSLSGCERFFLRRYSPKIWKAMLKTGIGGIHLTEKLTVKCLHLQAATMLALPGHPAEAWFAEKFKEFCCKKAHCKKYLD